MQCTGAILQCNYVHGAGRCVTDITNEVLTIGPCRCNVYLFTTVFRSEGSCKITTMELRFAVTLHKNKVRLVRVVHSIVTLLCFVKVILPVLRLGVNVTKSVLMNIVLLVLVI